MCMIFLLYYIKFHLLSSNIHHKISFLCAISPQKVPYYGSSQFLLYLVYFSVPLFSLLHLPLAVFLSGIVLAFSKNLFLLQDILY